MEGLERAGHPVYTSMKVYKPSFAKLQNFLKDYVMLDTETYPLDLEEIRNRAIERAKQKTRGGRSYNYGYGYEEVVFEEIDDPLRNIEVKFLFELERTLDNLIENKIIYEKPIILQDIDQYYSMMHLFRIAGVLVNEKNKRYYKLFRSKKALAKFIYKLIESKGRLTIVAHNMMFDLLATGLDYFLINDYGFKVGFINDEVGSFIMRLEKDEMSVLFFDTYNLLKASMNELTQVFNLESKIKIEDFSNASEGLLQQRVKLDVILQTKVLERAIKLFKKLNINPYLTLSSTGSNLFLKKRLKFKKLYQNEDYIKGSIISYRGGRSEVFKIGRFEGLYVLDVNSMYPFVMNKYPYPVEFIKELKNPSKQEILDLINNNYIVLARVYIKEDYSTAIGLKTKDHLEFPYIKDSEVWINTREVQYLIENNFENIEIKKAFIFKGGFIFKDIDNLYQLRKKYKKEGDKAMSLILKLLMNSAYGRFGMKNSKIFLSKEEYEKWRDSIKEALENNELEAEMFLSTLNENIHKWGNTEIIKISNLITYSDHVIIASEITSNARMYLFSLIQKALKENVYYCDTDSLFVNKEGFERLKGFLGDNLGDLKLEYEDVIITINNIKDYSIENKNGELIKRVLKGVPKDALMFETDASLNKYKVNESSGILVARDIVIGAVLWRTIEKIIDTDYKKGTISKDGSIIPNTVQKYKEPLITPLIHRFFKSFL